MRVEVQKKKKNTTSPNLQLYDLDYRIKKANLKYSSVQTQKSFCTNHQVTFYHQRYYITYYNNYQN